MTEMAYLTVLDSSNNEIPNRRVPVHFNPERLTITYSFTGSEGSQARSSGSTSGTIQGRTHQRTDFSVNLSALQLFFDTTQTGEDVRNTTLKIAAMLIVEGGNQAPKVRFHWGTFTFSGTIDSMRENLDYFTPLGVPLRGTVDLTMSMVADHSREASSLGLGASLGFSAGFSASAGISANASASASISAGINASASASFSASAGANAVLSAGAAVGTSPLSLATSGESIQSMSARAGVDWKVIAAANNIDNPRQLQAGAVINLNAGLR